MVNFLLKSRRYYWRASKQYWSLVVRTSGSELLHAEYVAVYRAAVVCYKNKHVHSCLCMFVSNVLCTHMFITD
jgi:hypothetical protein